MHFDLSVLQYTPTIPPYIEDKFQGGRIVFKSLDIPAFCIGSKDSPDPFIAVDKTVSQGEGKRARGGFTLLGS